MKKIIFLFLLLACTLGLFAQQPSAAPAATVIKAGHMLDVKTGHITDNATIVIENGKIASIGSGAAPAGATVINLPNATLLPGLIDAHTHLTYDPNFGYQSLGISVPKETLIGAKNAPHHAGSRIYYRAQRGSDRLQRYRVA